MSQEEIFDVVNERDEVIGQNTRAQVHRQKLLHRAVHVLVFNRRGEVFLQRRSWNKDGEPGRWDSSASGHVGTGETYDACAVRELREEIGLRPSRVPKPLFKIDACPETHQEHTWVYWCEDEGPFELNAEEIAEGDWFAPAELSQRMAGSPAEFASALRILWPKVLALQQAH